MSSEEKEELKPIDNSDDVQKYNAFSESLEINFRKCPHNKEKLTFQRDKQSLRCTCGAAWSGPGLNKLYDLLITRKGVILK